MQGKTEMKQVNVIKVRVEYILLDQNAAVPKYGEYLTWRIAITIVRYYLDDSFQDVFPRKLRRPKQSMNQGTSRSPST